ncbi:MAG: hypothetical protein OJF52_000448 [Nitrospira sp.]|jgi:hypothetical protein|nr:MAG: hypothetical protein OJF52_000448 [Nitrospira sp.]
MALSRRTNTCLLVLCSVDKGGNFPSNLRLQCSCRSKGWPYATTSNYRPSYSPSSEKEASVYLGKRHATVTVLALAGWLTDSCGWKNSHMTNSARKISDEGIDSLIASQALNELFQQERQSREDRVSIWLVSLGMVIAFLILVLFMIQIVFSRPNNTHPTESAWYRHALPPVKIHSRDRSGPFFHRPATPPSNR